jgi:hypothetical protein
MLRSASQSELRRGTAAALSRVAVRVVQVVATPTRTPACAVLGNRREPSRWRPVLLVAVTTVLGMIPLLQDALFSAMAATIMFGLAFARVLTMIVVPEDSQHKRPMST